MHSQQCGGEDTGCGQVQTQRRREGERLTHTMYSIHMCCTCIHTNIQCIYTCACAVHVHVYMYYTIHGDVGVQVIQAGMFDQKSTTSERKAFLEALLEEEGIEEEV